MASLVRVASSYRLRPNGKMASGVAPGRRTEMEFGHDQRFGTTLGLSADSGVAPMTRTVHPAQILSENLAMQLIERDKIAIKNVLCGKSLFRRRPEPQRDGHSLDRSSLASLQQFGASALVCRKMTVCDDVISFVGLC